MPSGIYKRNESHLKQIREMAASHKGIPRSKEVREKISKSHFGIKPNNETRLKLRNSHLGKKQSEEVKIKRGVYLCGSQNHSWKGGNPPIFDKIRRLFKYRQWRSDIFSRDFWTCQKCNKKNNIRIETHHIKSFRTILYEYKINNIEQALNCEELWDINNGLTLCINCHRKAEERK